MTAMTERSREVKRLGGVEGGDDGYPRTVGRRDGGWSEWRRFLEALRPDLEELVAQVDVSMDHHAESGTVCGSVVARCGTSGSNPREVHQLENSEGLDLP
ncbi:MAG: hypothetical protein K8J08_13150 [Thermoanaerobaculia bacterium]|nr:hypothetical protein [Thermoanaerobaculia bacterium]